jgi:hypothetical protein
MEMRRMAQRIWKTCMMAEKKKKKLEDDGKNE